MKITMPENVSRIINILNKEGYEAYAVGGCVRDTLLNRIPGDWDITTSAKPEQVKALFRRTVDTGIKHGTVTVMFGKEGYEVTTYRIDGDYEDGRHPKEVTFTSSLIEDLKRRDFTINAMAYCDENGIVDEFDGLKDLENRVIRAVGDPKERFTEDALRILRALRFSAQLNYTIEDDTVKAIKDLKENLKQISAERIRVELTKLLMADHPEKLMDAYQYGITGIVLPVFDSYSDEERDSVIAALKETVRSLKKPFSDKAEEYLRYAVLLRGAGAERSRKVLRDLKFDNETIRCVTTLIDNVIFPELTPASVRRSIVNVGADIVPVLIRLWRVLQSADFGECHQNIDEYEDLYKRIIANGDCISIKDLAVTGRDLIDGLGMKPGKDLGNVLNELFDRVLDNPELNEKDTLLIIAKGMI